MPPRVRRLELVMIAALIPGCATSQPNDRTPAVVQQGDSVAAQAQVRRLQTTEQLKKLTVPELAKALADDSLKGREPFNSLTFSEALRRKDAPNYLQDLSDSLVARDRSSLLGLLALRRTAPELYRRKDPSFKVDVLIDALKNSRYFNAFGLPHLRWEEAAQALIDEGEAAVTELKPLLADNRPAAVWGSEDYAEYRRYDYRVQDYALALILTIRKQPSVLPVDRQERLRLMERLR